MLAASPCAFSLTSLHHQPFTCFLTIRSLTVAALPGAARLSKRFRNSLPGAARLSKRFRNLALLLHLQPAQLGATRCRIPGNFFFAGLHRVLGQNSRTPLAAQLSESLFDLAVVERHKTEDYHPA